MRPRRECEEFCAVLDQISDLTELVGVQAEVFDQHRESCPQCAVQASLVSGLTELGQTLEENKLDDLALARKVNGVLNLEEKQRNTAAPRPQPAVWVAGGVAAAACVAVIVFVVSSSSVDEPQPRANLIADSVGVDPVSAPRARLIEFSGAASLSGRPVGPSEEIGPGQTLEVSRGRAMLQLEIGEKSVALLNGGAKLSLVSGSPGEYRVRHRSGETIFQISKLEQDSQFIVETNYGEIHVLGTVFSVSCQRDGLEIRVAQGTVRIDRSDSTSHFISAGELYFTTDRSRQLTSKERSELLEQFSAEALTGTPSKDKTPSGDLTAVPGKTERWTSKKGPLPEDKGDKEEARLQSPPPTAEELLERARAAQLSGNWSAVASAYKQLIALYPESPDAQTALILVGRIQLDHLSRPAVALRSFRRYLHLSANKALAEEAHWGIALALKSLGRTDEELVQCKKFIQAYPGSLNAGIVWARIKAIESSIRTKSPK